MHPAAERFGWGRVGLSWMTAVLASLWMTGMALYGLPTPDLMEMAEWLGLARRSSVILHGVLTWLFCVLCGRYVWPHARLMWTRRSRPGPWRLGVANLSLMTTLALAGCVLLYGSTSMHDALAAMHFWGGACSLPLYLWHVRRRSPAVARVVG